jgi:hypothetical protein
MKQSIDIKTSATRELSLSELDGVAGGKKVQIKIGPVQISFGEGTAAIGIWGLGFIAFDKGGGGALCGQTNCIPF